MGQDGQRLLQRLRKLVALASAGGREERVQSYLEATLQVFGFETQRQEVAPGRWNLYARRGASLFLIATHADTVPRWGHPDGFRLRLRGGMVSGRGVVDTKGQIAALLEACAEEEIPACLAFFVDEEGLGSGSELFQWPWPDRLAGAVVLEPTGLRLATAQAGSFELEVRVKGKAWHGASFRESDNAILRAAELIAHIRALPFWTSTDPRFGRLGITVGRIRGGRDVQVIPDCCEFQIDLPILPEHGLDQVRDAVLRILEAAGASYAVHHHEPPFETGEDEAVVRVLREAHQRVMGRTPEIAGFSAWTDAANLARKGLPSVVYGAGELALAHSPEEAVRLSDLIDLRDVLREFLRDGGLRQGFQGSEALS